MAEDTAVSVVEMKDMKETTELLKFALHLCKSVAVSLNDGKIDLMDMTNFWGALMEAGTAFEGIGKIPGEFGDITGEELDMIKEVLIKEFPFDIDGIDKIINIAFNAGSAILELVSWFKAKA